MFEPPWPLHIGLAKSQEDAAASMHPDTPPLAGLLADFDAEAERCAARGGARGDGGAEVGAGCGGDGAASAQDKVRFGRRPPRCTLRSKQPGAHFRVWVCLACEWNWMMRSI